MTDRLGNAALIWSATSDASGQRVHLLQTPLRSLRAGHSMQTFQRQSLDRSVLENVAIGDGTAELRGRVRYDHDAEGLTDALVAGSAGKTLRYVPELSDPDVDFQCDLVAPLAPFGLELDPQRGVLGDQSVELVLRVTDQSAFDPLYHGSAVLFSYRAGGSLEASSSFGRVTSSDAPATFADIDAGAGFGNLSSALSNQARIHWMSGAASCGPRTFPTLLLEDTRKDFIDETQDFGSTATWERVASSSDVSVSSEQPDPAGTTDAWLLGDESTAVQGIFRHEFASSSSGDRTASIFIKENDDVNQAVTLGRTTGVETVLVQWSSGEPTVEAISTGVGTIHSVDLWREGFWRIPFTVELEPSTNSVRFQFVPAASTKGSTGSVATSTGTTYFYGAMVE